MSRLCILSVFSTVLICRCFAQGNRCGGSLSGPTGIITTPDQIDNNWCTWDITVADGRRVTLIIHTVNLDNGPQCQDRFLQVYDGISRHNSKLRGTYCNLSHPTALISSGNHMTIYLFSRSSSVPHPQGFWANYYSTEIECPVVELPTNGLVTYNPGRNVWDTLTYTCNAGYVIHGTETRTCLADGKWTPMDYPTCQLTECPAVSQPQHGFVIYPDGWHVNAQLKYQCEPGYELQGTETRRCQADGRWIPNRKPTCNSISCGRLNSLEHGHFQYLTGGNLKYHSTIEYICYDGYRLTGKSLRVCQANGAWSGTTPSCELILCPHIPSSAWPSNRYVTYTGDRRVNTTLMYKCDGGYALEGSPTTRWCQSDGNWTPVTTEPNCTPCGGNLTAPTGVITTPNYPDAYPRNSKCEWVITASEGSKLTLNFTQFNLADSDSCQFDYVKIYDWDKATSQLIGTYCGSDVKAAIQSSTNALKIFFNSGYHIEKTGFRAVYHSSKILCNNLLAPGNGTVVYTMDSAYSEYGHLQGKTLHGHKAIFTCDEGFILNGSAILTCIGNEGPEGRFDGQPPSCESIAATAALISTKTKIEANRFLYTVILLILLMISLLIIGILVVYVIMLKRQRTDDTVQMYNNTYYDTSSRAVTFATAAGMPGNTDRNQAMTSVNGNNATDDTEIVVNEYYDSFEASGGSIAQSSAQKPAFKIGPATGDVYAKVQKEEDEQLYANM